MTSCRRGARACPIVLGGSGGLGRAVGAGHCAMANPESRRADGPPPRSSRDGCSGEGRMREIAPVDVATTSREHERDLLGHEPTRHPLEAAHGEQATTLGSVQPSNERDPALRRRCPHDRCRRRRRPHRRRRRAAGVRRDGARHRAGAVPPTGHETARPDHQHRLAAATPVATQHDVELLWRAPRLERATHLTSNDSVADDHQPCPDRRARGAASRATGRAARRARRQPREPGLDLQLGCDKPGGAS